MSAAFALLSDLHNPLHPWQVRMQSLQAWLPEGLRQQGGLGSPQAAPARSQPQPPDLEPAPAAPVPGSAEQQGMLEAALHSGLEFKSAYQASPMIAAVRVRGSAAALGILSYADSSDNHQ
jgi:hypothetical protein